MPSLLSDVMRADSPCRAPTTPGLAPRPAKPRLRSHGSDLIDAAFLTCDTRAASDLDRDDICCRAAGRWSSSVPILFSARRKILDLP